MHTSRFFFVALICSWTPYCAAQVTYEKAKGIFAAGKQDFCFDGPYHAKSNDRWLALVSKGDQWSLEKAVVERGRVKASSGKPHFFIKWKDHAFVPGPVTSATITELKQKTGQLSDRRFTIGSKTWDWIEWGADYSFYLSQGTTAWVPADNWYVPHEGLLTPGHPSIPPEVTSSKDQFRDLESPGEMRLVWAGDLNGDTYPELITFRQVKEVWGLKLWSSFIDKDGTMKLRLVASEDDGCD